jgi:hypothetical protein
MVIEATLYLDQLLVEESVNYKLFWSHKQIREKLSFGFLVFISSEKTLHSREAVARWCEMEFPDHKVAWKKKKSILKFK